MKLEINGETYLVPRTYEEPLTEHIEKEIIERYQKLDKAWRIMAQAAATGTLKYLEFIAVDKIKAKEQFRLQDRHADPVPHLVHWGVGMLSEGLKYVVIVAQTGVDYRSNPAGEKCITGFNVQIEQTGADKAHLALKANTGETR